MPPTPSQIALASHLLRGRESPIASCNHEVTGHPQKAPFRLRSRLVSEPHINLETAVFHHSRDVEDTGTGDGILTLRPKPWLGPSAVFPRRARPQHAGCV